MLAGLVEQLETLSFPRIVTMAQGEGAKEFLQLFKFTGSDPATTNRFILATIAAIVLSLIFWGLNRTSHVWLTWLPGAARKRSWDAQLRARGLGPEERSLVSAIAKNAGTTEIREILRSRVSFENAVTQSERFIHSEARRVQALDRVRRRLSWESAPAPRPNEVAELLEHNLEVEIFGTGETAGYCVRATLVHRDADSIVMRVEKDVDNIPWGAGATVRVYFWRDNDAGYLFDAPVIELRNLGEMFLFVKPPAHLERHQRRLHVRVPLRAPVTFLRVASGEAGEWLRGENPDSEPLRGGVIEDLSAGGFLIRCTTPLQIGDFLSFDEFPVVNGEEVLARVISERREEGDAGYHYGAQFLGMSATMRDLISQHIFRLQRQLVTGKEWGGKTSAAEGSTESTSPMPPSPPPNFD